MTVTMIRDGLGRPSYLFRLVRVTVFARGFAAVIPTRLFQRAEEDPLHER